MWTISKTFRFEASHQLPEHDGKCARLHGHSWSVTVTCQRGYLESSGPKSGMVMDYASIKDAMRPLLEERLDHFHLNDSTGLSNPTSEELARWIYNELSKQLPDLRSVRVDETCTCQCEYRAP